MAKVKDVNNLFYVVVLTNEGFFPYMYGNYKHANEHYQIEKAAGLYEVYNDKEHYVKSKGGFPVKAFKF